MPACRPSWTSPSARWMQVASSPWPVSKSVSTPPTPSARRSTNCCRVTCGPAAGQSRQASSAAPVRVPHARLDRQHCSARRLLPNRSHRAAIGLDRKSTRLNSSHLGNSYAVLCLEEKDLALSILRALDTVLKTTHAIDSEKT